MTPARVDILGVGFDRVDLAAAAERIIERHAAEQRTFVITANPEFVMLARRDAELGTIARAADLVVADGTGVLVASRVLRDPLPGRVPGRLLVPAVLQLLSGPVFLLGAAPGVAERAAATLERQIPSLRVAGAYAGSPIPEDDASIRERVQAAGARVLLVAYGMPAQEHWIARNLPLLPSVRTAIGVGGVFDQLAGRVRVPPRFIHAIGLEWLWRLAFEPRRWRRQRALPVFAALVARQRILGR
ncbi:MAG TPA: WecB/TagA/CpsF family glycosyltransferase [Candidatus Limnocylindria bacterium]|nr:WecB/TagA/CpsF family glycosyltransferase [Candidatus Limnocylindria bacterium]